MHPNNSQSPSIGHRTASGFAWLLAQSVGDKIVSALAMIALARLLDEKAYDLVALTYTVTTFTALFQQAGLREVLIQRHGRYKLWANAVFWMSLTIGLAAGLLTAAAAPAAAHFYQRPELLGLLLVAATTLPLNALPTVPEAALRGRMQFRFLAGLGLFSITATMGLAVVFATMGLGAYSFILPQPIVALMRSAAVWWAVRPRVRWRPQIRRWRHLVGASSQLLVASVSLMVTYQGSTVILGYLYPDEPHAGIFYFAWSLSDQATRFLVNNLAGVLFPALNTLADDRDRQAAAFVRAVRALLIVGLPLCLMQALLAGPVIRLLFTPTDEPDKWLPAIPVMITLSIGMSARLITGPVESIFLAQRRSGLYMVLCVVYAAAFVATVWVGAQRAAATGAAVATTVCLLVLAPVSLYLALRPAGHGWRRVGRVYGAPAAAAALAFAPAAWLVWRMPPTIGSDLAAIALGGSVSGALYLALIWFASRDDVLDLVGRVGALARRRPSAPPGLGQPPGLAAASSGAGTAEDPPLGSHPIASPHQGRAERLAGTASGQNSSEARAASPSR